MSGRPITEVYAALASRLESCRDSSIRCAVRAALGLQDQRIDRGELRDEIERLCDALAEMADTLDRLEHPPSEVAP